MPRLGRPAHVLAVHSAVATSRYFQDQLGFEEYLQVGDDQWRFVRRDDCDVMLGSCPDDVAADQTGCHGYFAYWRVDDIDALHAEWTARGALVISAPEDKPWGMREFAVRTPDGHRLTVGQELRRA